MIVRTFIGPRAIPPLFATCGLFCVTSAFVCASTRGAAIANAEIKQSAGILNGFINLPRRLNITNCSFVATFCATQSCASQCYGASLDFHNVKITRLLLAVSVGQKGKMGPSLLSGLGENVETLQMFAFSAAHVNPIRCDQTSDVARQAGKPGSCLNERSLASSYSLSVIS